MVNPPFNQKEWRADNETCWLGRNAQGAASRAGNIAVNRANFDKVRAEQGFQLSFTEVVVDSTSSEPPITIEEIIMPDEPDEK